MSAKPEDFPLPDPEVAREVFSAASELAHTVLSEWQELQVNLYYLPDDENDVRRVRLAKQVVAALAKAAHSGPRKPRLVVHAVSKSCPGCGRQVDLEPVTIIEEGV